MKTLIKLFFVFAAVLYGLNIAAAQSVRKQKKADKIAAIKKMLDDKHYIFEACYANPLRGGEVFLTTEYNLTITTDTVRGYLPYYGRAFVAPLDPNDGPIDLTLTKFEYTATEGKNGGWEIIIKPLMHDISNIKDVQLLRLSISANGYASLQVTSTNRDVISFSGNIEALKPEGKK